MAPCSVNEKDCRDGDEKSDVGAPVWMEDTPTRRGEQMMMLARDGVGISLLSSQ